jgi:hypothetical protein
MCMDGTLLSFKEETRKAPAVFIEGRQYWFQGETAQCQESKRWQLIPSQRSFHHVQYTRLIFFWRSRNTVPSKMVEISCMNKFMAWYGTVGICRTKELCYNSTETLRLYMYTKIRSRECCASLIIDEKCEIYKQITLSVQPIMCMYSALEVNSTPTTDWHNSHNAASISITALVSGPHMCKFFSGPHK